MAATERIDRAGQAEDRAPCIEQRSELIEELAACPFCAAVGRREMAVRGCLRIVRCTACGLLYADRRWNAQGMSEYYGAGYFTGQVPGAHRDYLAEEQEKLADFEHKYRSLTRFVSGRRLLDVGCATGFSLSAASRLGFEAEGVEYSEWAVGQGCSGCRVWQGDVNQLACAPPYDLVSMWDVVEHLLHPEQTFAKLQHLLRPGGVLALTYPDPTSTVARLLGRRWSVLNPAEHYLICPPRILRVWLGRHRLAHLADLPELRQCTLAKLAEKVVPALVPVALRSGLGRRIVGLRVPYKRLAVFRRW